MKKLAIILSLLLIFTSACGKNNSSSNSDTVNYIDDTEKKVKVPKNPKRIVVLHPTYVGSLIKLGHKPVAVPSFVSQNKVLSKATKGIKKIDMSSVEQVTKQKPDLIITTVEDKNIKKLKKVAPTVAFDAQKTHYKDTLKKLSKLVNEEKKADKWIKNWDAQMKSDKKELNSIIKDKSISVLQEGPKGISVFSDHLGRGTEVVYDGYGMKQIKSLKEATKKATNITISNEKIEKYTGDFALIVTQNNQKPEFENSNYWKSIPAVKNNNVIKLNASDTQFNDPISLEAQRDIIYKQLKQLK